MRVQASLCLSILLWLAVCSSPTAWAQAPAATAAPIRLRAAGFTPGRGEAPTLPPGLAIQGYAEGQRGYYLVQFRGPVLDVWKANAGSAGAELLEYVPDFAFKVRMTPAQARALGRQPAVAWIGLFHPAYKLSPQLTRAGQRLYRVRLERGVDQARAVEAVTRAAGANLVRREGAHLLVIADGSKLDAIAHVLDVAWIEDFQFHKKHNEYGGGAILGANTANANGYNGSTQTVAIADTGLGGGTVSTAHRDLPSTRFHSISNWPGENSPLCYNVINDGAADVDSGHGTHTTLSMAGAGGPGGEGRGTAPAAKVFFQAVENYVDFISLCSLFYLDGYYLIGIPLNIADLLAQGYASGSRVHSNSWGSDSAGAYTTDSMNADSFMWTQKRALVLFSSGNAGTDANADGVVDGSSIGSPATAKNVLAVGASENNRQGNYPCDTALSYTSCAAQGGQNNIFTYGAAWPSDFPSNPLASDRSAGNAEQMAAFSSRGPSADGRIKPDVVAPGTWVLSGYSDLYQQGYDGSPNPRNGLFQYDGWGFPQSAFYKFLGGTSMSTPLAAGGAALVRDFYEKAHSYNPSAALVKATLIHTAVDLLDENNDGVNDNAFPIPNVHEGWGRVDLAAATSGQREFVDETNGLGTGGSATFTYTTSGGTPFKMTLVWTDFQSTETAAVNLVNDLDLEVTSPADTLYRGNVFSGGWSQAGGSADRRNNVENVYIQSAAAGTWTVTVRAFNVPNGPQPFALVVTGAGGAPPPPNQPPTASFTFSCTNLSCNFDGSSSSDADGTIVSYTWDFGDGASGSGVTASHTYAAAGTYSVTLTVTDDDAATGSDTQNVTVSAAPNQPPTASFTFSCTNLSCNFDGSSSSDADGTIVSYAWDFGDGASGSGVTASHTYAAAGTYSVTLTVTDDDAATGSDTQNVTVSAAPNQPPTASFTFSCTNLSCNFDGSSSSDADGTIVSYAWDFGDGASGSGVTASHTYAAAGTYSVTLTVTDDDAATGSDTQNVTVTAPPDTTMHVGDLDGAGAAARRNQWTATVTITVHDAAHNPLPNATVSGTWTGGYSGTGSCTTNGSGQCSIISGNIPTKKANTTFTVGSIAHASRTYQATANHDPDGDSNSTSITVNRP